MKISEFLSTTQTVWVFSEKLTTYHSLHSY